MTTPAQSPTTPRRFGTNPSTPTKPRVASQTQQSPSMAGGFDGSPASTFSSSATTGTAPSQPDVPQPGFRSLFASANVSLTPTHLYVRADPALLTCFDPADKELYDLWAPKR